MVENRRQAVAIGEIPYTCKFCRCSPATCLIVYEFTPPKPLRPTAIPPQDRRMMALVCKSCGLIALDNFRQADLYVHDIFWNPHLFELKEATVTT